jgi:hypothetical protein
MCYSCITYEEIQIEEAVEETSNPRRPGLL